MVPRMACALWLACAAFGGAEDAAATRDALARYVAAPDASYRWSVRRQGTYQGLPYVELTLTSQTWRGVPWRHQLFVLQPPELPADAAHALLFITGGSWNDKLAEPPTDDKLPGDAALFAALTRQLKTPVAVLMQVPHQPLFDGKYEDAAIAYTFERYLQTGDAEWPLLLPMVKSAVRGMDAVQEFAEREWQRKLTTFTVTGASKRGWTTWLTGAVDKRATAIAPMVIDMLNMAEQLKHQRAAWGRLSEQISDYTERGLERQLDTPRGRVLQSIVDPHRYREKLQQPKLIVLGTNDPYWSLDALNLYWDDLAGSKHILYVPNNRHGLKDHARVVGSLHALHLHAKQGRPLPRLTWAFANGDGQLRLRVTSDPPAQLVQAWTTEAATQDFRQAEWKSTRARREGAEHECSLAVPAKGFAAMFAEAVYDCEGLPCFFSTNIRIVGNP